MTEHNPGPWIVRGKTIEFLDLPPHGWSVWADNGRFVCCFERLVEEAQEQQALDIGLIAAAPDLEEALRGMLSIHDSVTMGQQKERQAEWIPRARAALAKASAIPSTVL